MSVITISRGTFSGGRDLAECLARRLDYPCVSREVILDAAYEHGVPLEQLVAAIEKPPSLWQQLTGGRMAYLSFVRAALCERAVGGNLVYHGHAGHLLLAGISHVIRVRVIADLEFRVRAAMERRHVDRKEAIAQIRKVDQERMRWTRFLYGVNWYDASLFDVVLNLGCMSVEDACDVVVRMTEMPRFKPTPESRKAAENLALDNRVWAVLASDPRTATADVRVAANDGVVTITGSSLSRRAIEAIPQVASQVRGVRQVHCLAEMGSVYAG